MTTDTQSTMPGEWVAIKLYINDVSNTRDQSCVQVILGEADVCECDAMMLNLAAELDPAVSTKT